MKSSHASVLLAFVVCVLPGCENKGGGGAATLSGDMTGATSVAIYKAAPDAPQMQSFGEPPPSETPPAESFSTLVKIDADGNLGAVFNQQRPVFAVKVTTTHVVAFGDFHDIRAQVADGEDEKAIDCYLVAFPRNATGEAVKCLSQVPIGVYPLHPDSTYLGSNRVDKDPLGFSVRGADVYFTDATLYGSVSGELDTHLWRWSGGSDQIELLLQFDADAFTDNFSEPHVIENGGFACVQTVHFNIDFRVLCSPIAPPLDWQNTGATTGGGESGISYGLSLVMGTNLVLTGSVVSLVDGTTTATSRSLPRDRSVTLRAGEDVFGISGTAESGGSLIHVSADGTGTVLNGALDWDLIVGRGNYGYVYGDNELRRIDLAAAVLGTANLLGGTTLLNVTDMSLSSGPNIRIDGTTNTGIPSIVLINTSSGEITVTEEDVPRFLSVTPLE